MSAKSNNSIDRPFSKTILAKSKALAEKYSIVLVSEDGDWFGHALEMPNVYGDGDTVQKCVKNTIEALTSAVATMIEAGNIPPLPAKDGRRTEQVNVRLSTEEKAMLVSVAKTKGFKGLGDYIRAIALGGSL